MGPLVAALLFMAPAVQVEGKLVDAIDYRDVMIDYMKNPLLLADLDFPRLNLTGHIATPQSQVDQHNP